MPVKPSTKPSRPDPVASFVSDVTRLLLPVTPGEVRDPARLVRFVQDVIADAPLAGHHDHGTGHWHSVLRNGCRLCPETGEGEGMDGDRAKIRATVGLFALFHDCRRTHPYADVSHGALAQGYLLSLRNVLRSLGVPDRVVLAAGWACAWHTVIDKPRESVLFGAVDLRIAGRKMLPGWKPWWFDAIGTCLDADRLDLPRVGIAPSPEYLWTDRAKEEARNNTALRGAKAE